MLTPNFFEFVFNITSIVNNNKNNNNEKIDKMEKKINKYAYFVNETTSC